MNEFFGMPLHTDHPPVIALPLDAFDDPVRRERDRGEAGTHSLDGLMVKRIHDELVGTERTRESRSSSDAHVVHTLVARPIAIVRDGARPLAWQVLHERATEGDIDHLDAATDRERWHASRLRSEHQRELEGIALGVHVAQAWMRDGAIPVGVHILATGEQQAVHAIEHRVGGGRIDERKDVGTQARGGHRVGVRRVGTNAEYAADDFRCGGDSDGRAQSRCGAGWLPWPERHLYPKRSLDMAPALRLTTFTLS